MNKLIVVTGQTATGKTKYALDLAHKYDGEIINGDSRQIYKYLDIITGKDIPQNSVFRSQHPINNFDIGYYSLTTNHQSPTKIWLYDIIDPKIYFSSFDFTKCALEVIQDIFKRGKTPIIVGGTYFYLYHLLYDIPTQSIPADWDLRNSLNEKPIEELQTVFKNLDIQTYEHLNNSERNNPQRLIRKIELLLYTKAHKTKDLDMTEFKPNQPVSLGKKLGTDVTLDIKGFYFKDKERLRETVKQRVLARMDMGAIDEVKHLLDQGYDVDNPGLKTLGYGEIIRFLNGHLTKDDAVEKWINREIQYAKRQYTFMKRDLNIRWNAV